LNIIQQLQIPQVIKKRRTSSSTASTITVHTDTAHHNHSTTLQHDNNHHQIDQSIKTRKRSISTTMNTASNTSTTNATTAVNGPSNLLSLSAQFHDEISSTICLPMESVSTPNTTNSINPTTSAQEKKQFPNDRSLDFVGTVLMFVNTEYKVHRLEITFALRPGVQV
jgi:hypothetical protein